MADSTAAKAAVLGDPVAHSLSPILHSAGYEALSLAGWSYEAIRCPEGALARIVGSAGDEYRGFSVTMPGKPEALAFADEVTERARLVDSANTLVRTGAGWLADCTDIDGAFAALSAHEDLPSRPTIVLLGAGGTARPFIAAIARIPGASIIIATRRPTAGGALECAARFGVEARDVRLTDPELPALIESTDLVVNTIPEAGALELTELVRPAARLVDALYHPWPTPLGAAVLAGGGKVVGGDTMLLGQALGQFELFTEEAAPAEAMRAALRKALEERSSK